MLGPGQSFLVGIEDNGDGGLRLYLNHRSRGLYALVYDEQAKADVRRAWGHGGHVLIPTPPADAILRDRTP